MVFLFVVIPIFLFLAAVGSHLWRCRPYFPSNMVRQYFGHRDRLKWGALVGLAAAAVYGGLLLLLYTGYEHWGWGYWAPLLGLPVLVSLCKFLLFIPSSAARLAAHHIREARLLRQIRRQQRREAEAAGNPAPEYTAEQQEQLRAWARQALAAR
ncbi:MAG: hypothetical protein J0G30_12015 [Actinomycetales bacterium]|nr:hypothetical protein [Actinomycetales bacterium]